MNLTPLLESSPAVKLHVLAAVLAIALGAFQFAAPKGTMPHRVIGWVWVSILAFLCLSSFFIPGSLHLGPVSVFHVLSAYTLWALYQGARAGRRGDVADHRSYMGWLYGLSVVASAVIAVVSGGVLYQVFFQRDGY